MIVFYTEEDYQKEIEEAEYTAVEEMMLKLITVLSNKYEHLKYRGKDEQAEGVEISKQEVSLMLDLYKTKTGRSKI